MKIIIYAPKHKKKTLIPDFEPKIKFIYLNLINIWRKYIFTVDKKVFRKFKNSINIGLNSEKICSEFLQYVYLILYLNIILLLVLKIFQWTL